MSLEKDIQASQNIINSYLAIAPKIEDSLAELRNNFNEVTKNNLLQNIQQLDAIKGNIGATVASLQNYGTQAAAIKHVNLLTATESLINGLQQDSFAVMNVAEQYFISQTNLDNLYWDVVSLQESLFNLKDEPSKEDAEKILADYEQTKADVAAVCDVYQAAVNENINIDPKVAAKIEALKAQLDKLTEIADDAVVNSQVLTELWQQFNEAKVKLATANNILKSARELIAEAKEVKQITVEKSNFHDVERANALIDSANNAMAYAVKVVAEANGVFNQTMQTFEKVPAYVSQAEVPPVHELAEINLQGADEIIETKLEISVEKTLPDFSFWELAKDVGGVVNDLVTNLGNLVVPTIELVLTSGFGWGFSIFPGLGIPVAIAAGIRGVLKILTTLPLLVKDAVVGAYDTVKGGMAVISNVVPAIKDCFELLGKINGKHDVDAFLGNFLDKTGDIIGQLLMDIASYVREFNIEKTLAPEGVQTHLAHALQNLGEFVAGAIAKAIVSIKQSVVEGIDFNNNDENNPEGLTAWFNEHLLPVLGGLETGLTQFVKGIVTLISTPIEVVVQVLTTILFNLNEGLVYNLEHLIGNILQDFLMKGADILEKIGTLVKGHEVSKSIVDVDNLLQELHQKVLELTPDSPDADQTASLILAKLTEFMGSAEGIDKLSSDEFMAQFKLFLEQEVANDPSLAEILDKNIEDVLSGGNTGAAEEAAALLQEGSDDISLDNIAVADEEVAVEEVATAVAVSEVAYINEQLPTIEDSALVLAA